MSTGKAFSLEKLLNNTHERYRQDGRADVCKVHTGIGVDYVEKGGIAHGRLREHPWCDFQGTIRGGRAVAIEAKQTADPDWQWSEVKAHQREKLRLQGRLGAIALVYLYYLGVHYVIPWDRIGRGRFRPERYEDCRLPPGKNWLDLFAEH